MCEFDDDNNDNTFIDSDKAKDYQGEKTSEDLDAQNQEALDSMQEFEEDSETIEGNNEGLVKQQRDDQVYAEDTDLSDYKVMIDGKEFNQNNPLEGAKELIGHNEYDDAQWANSIKEAESYKEAVDNSQVYATGKNFGVFTPFAGKAMQNEFDRIHETSRIDADETEAMTKINHWSHDSYTEEYKPEDLN